MIGLVKSVALGAAALLVSAGVASAASYVPVGPQLDVAISTVTSGGWSVCYSADFGTTIGSSATTALAGCTGPDIIVAGHLKGTDVYALLAEAPKADALLDVGSGTGAEHLVNGSEWYNSDNWSFGFAGAGESVSRTECDTNFGADRLCIHTLSFVGGYRVGNVKGLNGSTSWEKVVLTDTAVPEPMPLALLGVGLLGLAAARRRS